MLERVFVWIRARSLIYTPRNINKNQKDKAFYPQMNANERKFSCLCACGALHSINDFAFICVHLRLFAVKMLLTFNRFREDSSSSNAGAPHVIKANYF